MHVCVYTCVYTRVYMYWRLISGCFSVTFHLSYFEAGSLSEPLLFWLDWVASEALRWPLRAPNSQYCAIHDFLHGCRTWAFHQQPRHRESLGWGKVVFWESCTWVCGTEFWSALSNLAVWVTEDPSNHTVSYDNQAWKCQSHAVYRAISLILYTYSPCLAGSWVQIWAHLFWGKPTCFQLTASWCWIPVGLHFMNQNLRVVGGSTCPARPTHGL